MGPDRFTCTKCQLRIWRHFMGYELTPTDLQEMLHGEKITSAEKVLTWKKDGQETTIRGRLVLNEDYKIRIAPKLKSKQPTDETCPKCKTGKLQLITAIDNSRWYGCNGFPQCRFTKPFLPHTFKTGSPTIQGELPKSGSKAVGENAQSGSRSSLRQEPSSKVEKRDTLKDSDSPPTNAKSTSVAQKSSAPAAAISSTPEGNGSHVSGLDRYQRIPKFVRDLLKLVNGASVESSAVPPSLSPTRKKTESNLKS